MDNFTFALPSGYDWEIKTFLKQVKTKKWSDTYASKLDRYADLLTSQNRDPEQVIGGMLQAAYGYNIGNQIAALLKPADLVKIRSNILKSVYK